jgi:hypothetical protein
VWTSGSLILSLATVAAFVLHPSAGWCVDCDFPNPWHVSHRFDCLLFVWSVLAPFIAAMFAFRMGWIVPLTVVFANLISQLLAGEPWIAFQGNEGPLILFLGLPITSGAFGLGWAVRTVFIIRRRENGQMTIFDANLKS